MVVKMTLIARDLMIGNPKLKEIGFGEESKGRNAILGGFQGQRQSESTITQMLILPKLL